jgi:hypothetical protein
LVVVAWVCAKPAFAAHANARRTPRVLVSFCRVIFNFSRSSRLRVVAERIGRRN